MNKLGKILEGSKILAITDKSGREYHFIGTAEKEKVRHPGNGDLAWEGEDSR